VDSETVQRQGPGHLFLNFEQFREGQEVRNGLGRFPRMLSGQATSVERCFPSSPHRLTLGRSFQGVHDQDPTALLGPRRRPAKESIPKQQNSFVAV